MVGREADYDFRDEPRDYGDVALSIQGVTVAEPDTGRVVVNNVSLDVRKGEIVCLYGLMGAGRTELMEALSGRDEIAGGRVLLGDEDLAGRTIQERIAMGVGLVPEDRQRDGLVQMMSVGRNMSLASLLNTVKNQFIVRKAERENVARQIADVRVKTAGPGALITSLSGGNQQKVVIGKMLLTDPKVLLLDEPTRGIDVGAKGEIFALLFREAKQGSRRSLRHVRGRRGTHRVPPHRGDEQGPDRQGVRPAHGHPRRHHGRLRRARNRVSARKRRRSPPVSTTTTRPAPAGAAPAPKGTPPARSINLNAILVEGRALIALIIIIAIFAVLSDNYLTTGNLTTITKQVAFNAIVALGMLLVILNGGIDLSVGSTVGLTGAVAGNLFRGVHVPFTDSDHVPERLGHRGHLGRHRHAGRTGQRITDRQAQPGAVHRHPRHALRGPRPDRGPAERPEHHQRVERPGGSRQHRVLRRLRQPTAGPADLGLGDDRVRHRDLRSC